MSSGNYKELENEAEKCLGNGGQIVEKAQGKGKVRIKEKHFLICMQPSQCHRIKKK